MWAEAECYMQTVDDPRALELVGPRGRRLSLEVQRWFNDADAADTSVIDRCGASVLDIGCGPGRMVRACDLRGLDALGIDIAPGAVALSMQRGGRALTCDVFEELPVAGPWSTVLLIDGNVGIGGDVRRLLTRASSLMAPHGDLIAESTPSAGQERRMRVRFGIDGKAGGRRFRWSVIGTGALVQIAARIGLTVQEQWRVDGREFTRFAR